jgi:transcriptional regulator with PAS, ATPase and Fis domain
MKKHWLILNPGTPLEKEIALNKPHHQIGRNPDASICIDNKNISGLHASIVKKEDKVNLIDLDSTNGTLLNGKKIKHADLKDGDRIKLADVVIVYREQDRRAAHLDISSKTEAYFPAADMSNTANIRKLFKLLVQEGRMSAKESDDLFTEWSGLIENTRRLDVLYHLLENTLFIKDKNALIKTVLQEIKALLSLDICGLYIREEDTFYVLEKEKLKSEAQTETISESLLDKVLRTAGPVFLENIGDDSNILGFNSLMQFKIQSILCIPVIDRSQDVSGVLYCVSKKSGQLNILQKDRIFLKACSSFIFLSLENLFFVNREKAHAHADERIKQEERFFPVIHKLKQEKENLSLKHPDRVSDFYGLADGPNKALKEFVKKASKADLPVLLIGETGAGKTVLAGKIHELSRPAKPFVTVDCTTIPGELLESELFGHEKGAFTGAHVKKTGKVTIAQDGTLFIDEIGDLPLKLQGKLLRLIQTGEYEPVGSTKTAKLRARLIFASNKDLKREIQEGRFREDLYFRLNVLQFRIAPIREKKVLILPLAEYFLKKHGKSIKSRAKGFTQKARDTLKAHTWPGNIRELENAVMRALVSAQGDKIDVDHLELQEYSTLATSQTEFPGMEAIDDGTVDLKKARERLDRIYIQRALALTHKNVSQAAKRLNISRNSLMDLIKKYQL